MTGSNEGSRRQGSVYIAVLATATLVTLIGVSGLLATRVQFRGAETTLDAIAASACAESALDMALLEMNSGTGWLVQVTPDGWSTERPLGTGTWSWMLSSDDALLDGDSFTATLFGRGRVGTATRIYSVRVQGGIDQGENLLQNGDIETGAAHWTGLGGCDLEPHTDYPHGGKTYLWVKNLDHSSEGPRQDITDQLVLGQTYETEVWVRTKDFSETVSITLWLNTSYGWYGVSAGQATAGTDWTRISGSVTPVWPGTLHQAYWKVHTAWSDQEFMIDDARLAEAGAQTGLVIEPIAGTYRRVVE